MSCGAVLARGSPHLCEVNRWLDVAKEWKLMRMARQAPAEGHAHQAERGHGLRCARLAASRRVPKSITVGWRVRSNRGRNVCIQYTRFHT